MQVIAAITLTDENILEYRVKPDPYSVWDSTTVYRRGRKVIVQDGYNKIYESVYPHSGMYPPDNTEQEQPAWILVRPINLWSMLGSVPDQRTQNNDEIYLKIAPKARVNAIGVHGVEADYINVKVWDAQENLVEDRTVNLSYTTTHENTVVTGRYTDTVIVRLPEHPQGVIEVTLAAPGEKVFCETMTFGEARSLGTTQPSARVTGIDPSLKAFDAFGRAYVQKRDMERSVSASVIIPWRSLDYSHKALADLRATPATWVASDTTPISIVYGMYRDFEINLSNRQVGLCNLDIQPIYYEPIRPPAVPVGDPVYFTSRPYPVVVTDSLNVGNAVAGEAQGALSIVTDQVSVGNAAIASATLRLPYVSYEDVDQVLVGNASISSIVLRLPYVSYSNPVEKVNVSNAVLVSANMRTLLLRYDASDVDSDSHVKVDVANAAVTSGTLRTILRTLPTQPVESVDVANAAVTSGTLRTILRTLPTQPAESVDVANAVISGGTLT